MDLAIPDSYDVSNVSEDMFEEEELFQGLTQIEQEDLARQEEARNVCAGILLDLVNLVVVSLKILIVNILKLK